MELATREAAAGILEALQGKPIEAKDGSRLRVNWTTSEKQTDNQSGEKGAGAFDKGERKGDGRQNDVRWKGAASKGTENWKGEPREAYQDGSKGGKDDGRKGKGKEGDGGKPWAYMDPHGEIQVGFSASEMRQWYQAGYFEGDLKVALIQDGGKGAKPKVPQRREFYALKHWFPDQSKAFSFIPRF